LWYSKNVKHELLEASLFVPESDALRFLLDPSDDTAPLVQLDSFEHTPTHLPLEYNRRSETVYGRVEYDGIPRPASIIVIMPNIFQRGVARLRGHEPRATVYVTTV
jgi:hypothetical protein